MPRKRSLMSELLEYEPERGSWTYDMFLADHENDGKSPGEDDYIAKLREDPSTPKPPDMPEEIASEAREQAKDGDVEPLEEGSQSRDVLYNEIKEMEAKDEELYGPKYRDDVDEK